MIKLKSYEDIEKLKIGGAKLAEVLKILSEEVIAGASTFYLNEKCGELMKDFGGIPSFLNYTPYGASRPFPANLCISLNHEVVHGIPNENEVIIKNGDIVTLDAGLIYDNLYTDHAVTVIVGDVDKKVRALVESTKEALFAGIKQARIGNYMGDIGNAIEEVANRHNFGIIEGLTGHGVGYAVHEDPYVPNYGDKGTGEKLKEGMVLALEPMFSLGTSEVISEENGYTFSTADGSLSAQFEHTIAITKNGPLILTKI